MQIFKITFIKFTPPFRYGSNQSPAAMIPVETGTTIAAYVARTKETVLVHTQDLPDPRFPQGLGTDADDDTHFTNNEWNPPDLKNPEQNLEQNSEQNTDQNVQHSTEQNPDTPVIPDTNPDQNSDGTARVGPHSKPQSILCQPILLPNGELSGVLLFTRGDEKQEFTEKHSEIAHEFLTWGGIVLHYAYMYQVRPSVVVGICQ